MERTHHLHHSRQLRVAHGRARGQTQPIPEECLGPPTPNPGGRKSESPPISGGRGAASRPDGPRCPAGRRPPYPPILGEIYPSPPKLGAGGASASQGIAVEREDFPFALRSLLQHAQLPATDGGQDVAQPVVVADLRVLTAWANSLSKASTCGPRGAIQLEAKTSWTYCCSRTDMWGRER